MPPSAGSARQCRYQRNADIGVLVHFRARQHVEGERQQGVAGENRGRLIEGLVHGRLAAPRVVIVHRRQVVVHQRIAMQQFDRAAGIERAVMRRAEQRRGLGHQKRAQPLAAAERGVAHGRDQPLRPRGLARQRLDFEQMVEQRLGLGGAGGEALVEVGEIHGGHN